MEWKHLHKPDHIGAQILNAPGTGWHTPRYIFPVLYYPTTTRAYNTGYVPVQLNNSFAPSSLVQTIHILGDKDELLDMFFYFRQGNVSGVGFDCAGFQAAHGIELPDHFRITIEGFRGGKFFRTEMGP
jgi:hypothetical protein